jgi:hypothetical protein
MNRSWVNGRLSDNPQRGIGIDIAKREIAEKTQRASWVRIAIQCYKDDYAGLLL